MSRTGVAQHYQRTPRIAFTVTRDTLREDCRRICERVRDTTVDRGSGVMVFVSPEGLVRLISEDSAIAPTWFQDSFAEFVGLYRIARAKDCMTLRLEGVIEDIADHMGWL